MITWVIFGGLVLLMFFAARYAFRKAKNGECVGCSGCKGGRGCCGCKSESSPPAPSHDGR
ncbi:MULTISPECIES: FeoB-associated Cys-rich membrane protein [Anaerotruncus]|uniref:FeoB-associated Cys-rich membrane protein n=1 Tax=Anaerotruncus TaxID=244127 RepID=UPI0008350698|nr:MULTISPECIES: FeoB-associated Cys-rich membrane protein [Anaerotruncus]RGX56206.1 FeoB-associated Cys-rich membrane protein [Anaerotruncus sp. AF02-27]